MLYSVKVLTAKGIVRYPDVKHHEINSSGCLVLIFIFRRDLPGEKQLTTVYAPGFWQEFTEENF